MRTPLLTFRLNDAFCFPHCGQYNIEAYPTTVIFNGSSVHEYEGRQSADGILEFVQVRPPPSVSVVSGCCSSLAVCPQDLVNPSAVVLDPSSFAEKVTGERAAAAAASYQSSRLPRVLSSLVVVFQI